ncbi:MAG: mandelate racemase/muconate lactonizing enzyme family protein [Anaerolineae bacterium]
MIDLRSLFHSPIVIEKIDVLRWRGRDYVRVLSREGALGIASSNQRPYLWPILKELVAPYFEGRDARDLPALVDGVYTYHSNYKLAGLAFWNCVSHVEFCLLDMLGKIAGQPVCELLGTVIRRQIPIYLSSMRRDTTPEEEVEGVEARLAETGARAVKFKIGGRMSANADAMPGRTERLIPLARKRLGDEIAIYVDANGSYDAEAAIEVGHMLEAHGVGFLEEPCPWEEYEWTQQVARELEMTVAGGEQDSSLPRFDWMIRHSAVDMVQPDLAYVGGFLRALRVASMAQQANMAITPHSSKSDANTAYMLHFAAVTSNAGPYQEYNAVPPREQWWEAPSFQVHEGAIAVPDGPGLGVTYDPALWREAEFV